MVRVVVSVIAIGGTSRGNNTGDIKTRINSCLYFI